MAHISTFIDRPATGPTTVAQVGTQTQMVATAFNTAVIRFSDGSFFAPAFVDRDAVDGTAQRFNVLQTVPRAGTFQNARFLVGSVALAAAQKVGTLQVRLYRENRGLSNLAFDVVSRSALPRGTVIRSTGSAPVAADERVAWALQHTQGGTMRFLAVDTLTMDFVHR